MLSLLLICLIAGGVGAVLQSVMGIGTGTIIVPLLTFLSKVLQRLFAVCMIVVGARMLML